MGLTPTLEERVAFAGRLLDELSRATGLAWDELFLKIAVERLADERKGLLEEQAAVKKSRRAVCCECGEPYLPKRRPKANQRNYCPDCRASGAAQRAAAREYRRRKRKES